jgi:hypothetical protein
MTRLSERLVSHVYSSDILRTGIKTGLLWFSSKLPIGTNVYDREWDVLVVLDTCRYDAFCEIVPEFEYLSGSSIDSIRSVGSATAEWSANTFIESYQDEIAQTAYVSSNGTPQWTLEEKQDQFNSLLTDHVDWRMVGPDSFLLFDSIWEYAPREPFAGLTIPMAVTDRAISISRELNPDRLIAHYMPPHAPYRANALSENRSLYAHESDPWKALRYGTDLDSVWDSYLDELRWGLECVEVLLRNIDAETVVITADHGDLFGEWGLYSHPSGVPHPKLRRVPWVSTSAENTENRTPSITAPAQVKSDRDLEEQLSKLGYL